MPKPLIQGGVYTQTERKVKDGSAENDVTLTQFAKRFLTTDPQSRKALDEKASQNRISRATMTRYLRRLVDSGAIASGGGFYWVPQGSG